MTLCLRYHNAPFCLYGRLYFVNERSLVNFLINPKPSAPMTGQPDKSRGSRKLHPKEKRLLRKQLRLPSEVESVLQRSGIGVGPPFSSPQRRLRPHHKMQCGSRLNMFPRDYRNVKRFVIRRCELNINITSLSYSRPPRGRFCRCLISNSWRCIMGYQSCTRRWLIHEIKAHAVNNSHADICPQSSSPSRPSGVIPVFLGGDLATFACVFHGCPPRNRIDIHNGGSARSYAHCVRR